MSATINGAPRRKQLSEQLDRFDALLDGLAEGLNDAIGDAVRDGTRLALKDAVIEILTDPTLRSKLQQASVSERPAQASAPRPGFFAWLKAKTSAILNGAKKAIGFVGAAAANVIGTVVETVRRPACFLQLIASLKHLLYVGVGAGLAITIVSFFAPHAVSAAMSGIGGAIAAMGLKATLWSQRGVRLLSPE